MDVVPLVTERRVRVLVVDDSAVLRQWLSRELSKDPEIEIVGTAADPFVARDKILSEKPDVVTLDIEMPRMNGLSFLRKLMAYHPLPVVVLSSAAREGTRVALEAYESGAVDVFTKPDPGSGESFQDTLEHLADALKAAAAAKIRPSTPRARTSPRKFAPSAEAADGFVALGASTGGTQALRSVLEALPGDGPGLLAVLHMPPGFTRAFAERLNEASAMEVREAEDGDLVRRGLALIAPGGLHLVVKRALDGFRVALRAGPPVCRHRPSVEVLFRSAAAEAGSRAMGVILTGMGADGADGLREMRDRGAYTVAQDEASSVVYGMPREAARRGAAVDILSLEEIPAACLRWQLSTTSAKRS